LGKKRRYNIKNSGRQKITHKKFRILLSSFNQNEKKMSAAFAGREEGKILEAKKENRPPSKEKQGILLKKRGKRKEAFIFK